MLRLFLLLSGSFVFYMMLGFWSDAYATAFHLFQQPISWRAFATVLFLFFTSVKFKGR